MSLLLGVTAVGMVLLPGLTAAYGFFLSFAVSCFASAFGKEGILLALAVFGLRCAISIPCYFLIAVSAWKSAIALAGLYFGRGGRTASLNMPWRVVAMVGAVLFLGACLDLYLTPWFLQTVLTQIFL